MGAVRMGGRGEKNILPLLKLINLVTSFFFYLFLYFSKTSKFPHNLIVENIAHSYKPVEKQEKNLCMKSHAQCKRFIERLTIFTLLCLRHLPSPWRHVNKGISAPSWHYKAGGCRRHSGLKKPLSKPQACSGGRGPWILNIWIFFLLSRSPPPHVVEAQGPVAAVTLLIPPLYIRYLL